MSKNSLYIHNFTKCSLSLNTIQEKSSGTSYLNRDTQETKTQADI